MIGYIKNKSSYYKGNSVDFNIEKAVALSGGTTKHYMLFKRILEHSLYNQDTKEVINDAKTAEFYLYNFPFKVQVVLSLLFYEYEIENANIYNVPVDYQNILIPSQQLVYNSIITRNKLNSGITSLVDNYKDSGSDKSRLFNTLDININYTSFKGPLYTKVEQLLSEFNLHRHKYNIYLDYIKNNRRLEVLVGIAKTLNYKPQSITHLTQALTEWQTLTSNI